MSWAELGFIALLALILVGPEHLPHYATKAAQWLKRAQAALAQTKQSVEQQLGATLPDSLAPRDIVRSALAAVDQVPGAGASLPDAVPLADPRQIVRSSLGLPAQSHPPGVAAPAAAPEGSDPRAVIRASLGAGNDGAGGV